MDSDYTGMETDAAECRYGRLRFPCNDSIVGESLRQYGEWAQAEIDLLLRFLRPGKNVVDVGAFIGTHTAAFASARLAGTTIHAFEPHPGHAAILRENARANDWSNVELHACALADEAVELAIAAERGEGPVNCGGTRLHDVVSPEADRPALAAVTLDSIGLTSCALIKADVEGMELRVLRGAVETIRRYQPVVYTECNSAEDGWGVLLHMRSLGYGCWLFCFPAFNPRNFRGRSENLFGTAREVGLLFLPAGWPANDLEGLTGDFPLARVDKFDDLVLGLLRKPQYKFEVLESCSAARVLRNDFWLNEPEMLDIRSSLELAEARAATASAQAEALATNLEEDKAALREARQDAADRAVAMAGLEERLAQALAHSQDVTSRLTSELARAEQLAERVAQLQEVAAAAARAAVQETVEQMLSSIRSEIADVRSAFARNEHRLEAERRSLTERAARAELAVAQSRAEIDAMKSSRSWRVSAPLRAVSGGLRAAGNVVSMRGPLVKGVRALYWNLPLGASTRRRIKEWVFTTFPGAFSHTVTFRQWRAFRAETAALAQLRSGPTSVGAGGGSGTAAPLPTSGIGASTSSPAVVPVSELPDADGRWEWADYEVVRERILQAESARRHAVEVKPRTILDFRANELDERIRRLAFAQEDAPLVSILVPTYNNLKYTVECLTSIMQASGTASFEVVVADDASTDGSADRLDSVPNLRVLHAQRNLGFLLNVNRALPSLRGRYVVLLNNDVQVQSGWLDSLLDAIRSAPDVGAVGPKIVYPSGHLQEAGCSLRPDGTSAMVGLGDDPAAPQYSYRRTVDYCSGACLLLETATLRDLGGFDESFAPAYYEDADLCLRLRQRGMRVVYEPDACVIHHLSKTTAASGQDSKLAQVGRSLARFTNKWQGELDDLTDVRLIAFYLPQFHPIPENDLWWGAGFTEWRNVARARPNFAGHYQPRIPADLGYYDLRVADVMERQAALARRYGLAGFCFYYYWFAGKRLLEMPIERLLETGRPDIPFCLCWANENWTRRWDGQDQEILMAQQHSDADDAAVIRDLMRYMRSRNYIRIDGKPLLLVYRVTLFPDFARTAATWRRICREEGLGEIYLAMVESFEMVFNPTDPARFGCDAAVEFPPQGMAEARPPAGTVLNPSFQGHVADYRDLAVRYCLRDGVPYVRFRGVMPGWDNTARRQNNSFCFEHATPGAFQAWAEHVVDETRVLRSGDERIVFVNAWNEWAEGAYLEPDRRFGHGFLEALNNARDAALLKRAARYALA